MYSWVKNLTDIENCPGRKTVFESEILKGNEDRCAFETLKDPGCGKSFFYGASGSNRFCYCESIGTSCPRTASSGFTEYQLIESRLLEFDTTRKIFPYV